VSHSGQTTLTALIARGYEWCFIEDGAGILTSYERIEAAALSPELTDEAAEALARHPHMTVRRATATNERTPPALLALLATDRGIDGVRWCFGCDGTEYPPPGMECDGTHRGAVWDLHYALADNPATPAAAVAAFVDHPSAVVRWTLAARTDQTEAIYQRLAADPVPGVRAYVAGNPAIGEALIRAMAVDRTHDVQRRLAHNPALPLDLVPALAAATRIGPTLLPGIARAMPDELEVLAGSPDPTVRMLVAQRLDLPQHLVDRLATDADAKVLASVAANPALAERQLRAMLAGHGLRVAARVAANPACSPELLTELAARRPSAHRVFRAIAAHPNATAEALVQCLADPSARPIAARHPALPAAALAALLDDPDPTVAENAAANPSLIDNI
jgi:hypothetical protein